MRSVRTFAGGGIALLLALTPAAWGQTTYTTTTTTTTTTYYSPHAGGVPKAGETVWSTANANYVAQKIAQAKAAGWDTSPAEVQENMGVTALSNGQDKEAAQHFEAALRSLDVMPKQAGENAGEAAPGHQTITGMSDTYP